MKNRIVACLLAVTMVFANVVPVMAVPENTSIAGEASSSTDMGFQETIDWLYEHSGEIGYKEISQTAESMKSDFSLLEERSEENAAEIKGLLNTYIKVRSRQESLPDTMDEGIQKSADQLWQYFTQSMDSVGGTVKGVDPKLQIREIEQKEETLVLSVYEWVYMTYEMNGDTDISACGITHRITVQDSGEGWRLVSDEWDNASIREAVETGDQAEKAAEEETPADEAAEGEQEAAPEPEEAQGSGEASGIDAPEEEAAPADEADEADEAADTEQDEKAEESSPEESAIESIQPDEVFTDEPEEEAGEEPADDTEPEEGSAVGAETEPEEGSAVDAETEPEEGSAVDAETEPEEEPGEAPEESTEVEYLPEGETEIPDEIEKEEAWFIPADEEDIEDLTEALAETEQISLFSLVSPKLMARTLTAPAISYTYDYEKAVAYAEKYAMNYNPAYNNYNALGGDCANFVSQCLYAGGLPMTDGWAYQKTSSWTYASSLYSYLAQNCGTAIVDPSNSQVRAGDPVFYYSSSQGRYSHAAICVGVNASNVPVVDAHNTDHLHAVWTLGSSWAKRAVIQMNTSKATSSVTAPTISAETPAEGETWQITASALVVRSEASSGSTKLTSIPKGTKVVVTDKKAVGAQTWGKTTYNGYTGWICMIYSADTSYAKYISGALDDVPITKLALDKTSATLSAGSTLTLKATVTPANATNTALNWTSTNNAVAKVDSSGVVTAVAAGSAVITVKASDGSGKSATCTVQVTAPVKSITLDKTSATLTSVGATTTVSVKTYSPSNATTKAVTWSSSNTKVATVDASGKVTAVANGTATITATAKDGGGAKATCKITVNIPVKEQWKITATSLTMRASAGTSGAKLGKNVPRGTTVTVTEKKTVGVQTWGKVTYGGKTGWICLIYSSNTSYATKVAAASGSTTTSSSTSTSASSVSEKWKVTASALLMRSTASTSGTYLGKTVPKGTTVTVTEKKSSGVQTWGKVTYGGKTGWICLVYNSSTTYAQVVSSSAASGSSTSSSSSSSSTSSASSEKWKVTASALLMRSSASTSGTYLGRTVPRGTTVTVTEKKTNGAQTWGKVTYSGTTGWICLIYSSSTSYAQVISSSSATTANTSTPASSGEKWSVTASALLMRSSASTSGTYLGKTVPRGATVTVTEKATNGAQTWGKVTYNGTTGWICLIYNSKTTYAKKQ